MRSLILSCVANHTSLTVRIGQIRLRNWLGPGLPIILAVHVKTDKYSIHSFGAHFCEIEFDPGIARLRVTRWVAVMDGGRVMNTKTGRSQILGGVVMGIGMGLFGKSVYDVRNRHPVNNNYADYMVPTNADIPSIDVTLLDYPDPIINEHGARGIGEIGITGVASALTSATYDATGVRVCELPIRIEDLLSHNG